MHVSAVLRLAEAAVKKGPANVPAYKNVGLTSMSQASGYLAPFYL